MTVAASKKRSIEREASGSAMSNGARSVAGRVAGEGEGEGDEVLNEAAMLDDAVVALSPRLEAVRGRTHWSQPGLHTKSLEPAQTTAGVPTLLGQSS